MTNYKKQDLNAKRIGPTITPDRSRVLLRPFYPVNVNIAKRIISNIDALSDSEVSVLLLQVMEEFENRHEHFEKLLLKRFLEVHQLSKDANIPSIERQLLIGSYFLHEYSHESAALFNPSIVAHPDQTMLPDGFLRFILSLRSTGEGHISSISFRVGTIDTLHNIILEPSVPFVTEPDSVPNAIYHKELFIRKLQEIGLYNDFCRNILHNLSDTFILDELRNEILSMDNMKSVITNNSIFNAASGILLLAESNYEVCFSSKSQLSQRVLFPSVPSQKNGIEDARFVRFQKEDGSFTYYATYTAYDGKITLPQLLETEDFIHFKFITLNGAAVQNKGMALFPRQINGQYAMLSRQDDENIFLMFSDNIHFWQTQKFLIKPTQPWEFIKIGTCGSPIETKAGWLVLSHGVGAMRKYCLGAFLLDLNDPSRIIGSLYKPLLSPNKDEREGYVPNVVYTCGALLHRDNLIIPYAMSDYATSFASILIDELLDFMTS